MQERFTNEIVVFVDGDYSQHAIRSLGTGRMTTWINTLNFYSEQSIFHQLIGMGRDFGAHNQYIAYLMLFGFLGLSNFLLIIVILFFRSLYRYQSMPFPEHVGAFALLIVFLANSFIGHPFLWSTALWHLMILLSVVILPIEKVQNWQLYGMSKKDI